MAQIKQSIAWWCYQAVGMTIEQLVHVASEIGYRGIELVEQRYWRHIKDAGLEIVTLKGQASIEQGFNRREHHTNLEREVLASITLAAQWGIPNVIVFSGNRDGQDDKMGAEITAQGLKRVAGVARNEGVTLLLELLNSRVDHPDYQADKTAWGVEVCQLVDSPAVRLLYDIYHMQIMEGDIIRTIQQHHTYFGHYHTAGNPGRHELNETQELQYGAIARAIAESGYDGYIGQEFVPIGEPETALRQAFSVCNAGMS